MKFGDPCGEKLIFKKMSVPVGALLAAIIVAIPFSIVNAQTNTDPSEVMDEIITIGTRVAGRSSADLPVPVDSLSEEVLESTGQTEVGRMLQTLAPSFNFSSSTISDGTDALRPATLRGLGPDQTLVLVNGKRRHTGALIHVNTSVGRGTAGVDLNAIPASSIKRIEVLRDGAAAQYGSDAIAGVINIILKDNIDETTMSAAYGEYSEGDGETTTFSINSGIEIGSTGYLNGTLDYRDRGATNRAGLSGQCQYLAGCADSDSDGIPNAQDTREVTFDRQNFRIGDADSEQLSVVLNSGFDVGGGEVYAYLTYSDRESESAGFYRRANQTTSNPTIPADGDAFYPNGFLPLINTEINDLSFGGGYRFEFENDLTMDVSIAKGENDFAFIINNSVNASFVQDAINNGGGVELRNSVSRSADAGELHMGLTTLNADFVKMLDSIVLAFGAEYRVDEYAIDAGEEYSYVDYDGAVSGTGSAGIQVFPGFQPANEVDEDRTVMSAYVDAEYDVTDRLLLSGAVRYDDYSDFGDTFNLKAAMRFNVADTVTLRGAVSTGFRAPSMQQQYFNNISTQFVGGVPLQVGTFRNDSVLAQQIGIPELKEEESLNLSVGIALEPLEGLDVTLDLYKIDIEDRIVISGQLQSGNPVLTAALAANQISSAQFFLNAADTETQGVDVVASYDFDIGDGVLDLTFAANFTDTEITDVFAPDSLQGVPLSQVFGEQDQSIIEEWQPEQRQTLTGLYSLGKWTSNLSFSRYGKYTVLDGGQRQTFSPKVLTDLRVVYNFDNGFSVNLGGNNIFDVTPDKNEVGQSRAGIIEDAADNVIVNTPGVFTYSRRSAPFGFNGAYYYIGMNYSF
ncbi:MAG: TonB-dependent receptor plug domain-containing protein [Cellvibrionaceae bacterium]